MIASTNIAEGAALGTREYLYPLTNPPAGYVTLLSERAIFHSVKGCQDITQD